MTNTSGVTKEQYIADRAKYIETAAEQVSAFNAAQNITAANAAEVAAKAAVKSANECALRIFLYECIEAAGDKTGNEAGFAAMIEACRRHTYTVHAVTITSPTESVKVAELTTKDKVVDLTKFNRSVLSPWFYRAELLAELMTRDVATGIGYTGKRLDDAMRFFKLSKEAAESPKVSKNTVKKALPEVVAAMLGGSYRDKVLPVDSAYLIDKFIVGGKAMTVKVASIKQVCGILADVCHRVLTDGYYTIEGRELKAPKQKAVSKPESKPESKAAQAKTESKKKSAK